MTASRPYRYGVFLLGLVAILMIRTPALGAPALGEEPPPDSRQRSEFMNRIIPQEDRARFPITNYDIGYDPGSWREWSRKVVGFFTDAWFSAGRWMVRATSWILSWAFSGGPNLTAPAKQLADAYDTRLIGPLGLLDMALLLAAAWTAWQMMRGRVAYGLSEFALTLVLLAVGTLIARDPVSFVGTAVRESRNLSADVLAISSGLPAGTRAETSLEPLKETVARTFVDQSYDLLNWGSALSGRCAEIRDEILRDGPWGTSETPRDRMRAEPECREHAAFNADPTGDRLFASMLLSVTAFTVLILILLSAATVLAARYAGDILIAVVGFAAVFALIPGRARALFWRWVTGVVQVAVVILGMAFILSLLVQATQVLLRQPTDTIAEKFGFLLVVVILMFVLRRRILGGGRALAAVMGRKLEAARPRAPSGPGRASGAGATGLGTGAGAFSALEELRRDVTLRRETARFPAGVPGSETAAMAGRASGAANDRAAGAGTGRAAASGAGASRPSTLPRAVAKATVRAQVAREKLGQAAIGARHALSDRGRDWLHGARHPVGSFRHQLERQKAEMLQRNLSKRSKQS